MKAAIITGIGQISIETVEDPKCEDREVIIEVAAAGICGTDLHGFLSHDPYNPAICVK